MKLRVGGDTHNKKRNSQKADQDKGDDTHRKKRNCG